MAEYVYPAIFHPNDDGSFTVTYPDLPGCISEGKTLGNAIQMAQRALSQWLEYSIDQELSIAPASQMRDVVTENGEFVSLIRAEIKSDRAVKRTVSIPRWMDDQASQMGLSLSRVLQDALKERLHAN